MKIMFPFFIIIAVILACGGQRSDDPSKTSPTPISSTTDRIVANTDVKDPKARFLGEATAYLSNLFNADKTMVERFTSNNGTKIKDLIIATHESEKKDFDAVEAPPPAYRNIGAKLLKIHRDHTLAYTEYLKTFIDAKEIHVDRGSALLKQSLLEMDETRKLITAALDRDVAR